MCKTITTEEAACRIFPILDLPGPEFLNVFGLVVIRVLAGDYLCIRLADRTDRRPPPPVPQNPDAMEVAFLQGGVNQVIRTLDLRSCCSAASSPSRRRIT